MGEFVLDEFETLMGDNIVFNRIDRLIKLKETIEYCLRTPGCAMPISSFFNVELIDLKIQNIMEENKIIL